MIVKFKNFYLQKLFESEDVSGKPKYDKALIIKFKKTILKLQFANSITEIRQQKGLNFESLKGDLKGYFSVRVDYNYRLILAIEKDKIEISEIILIHFLTNHYQ